MHKAIDVAKACLFVLLILTGGCAGTRSFLQPPGVELTSVAATNLSLTGQTFELGFDVSNPNPVALPVRSVRYQVRLNEQDFAGGQTSGSLTIPANGNGQFRITVDLDLVRSGSQLATLLRSGLRDDLRYEIEGNLDLALPLVPSLRFSNAGTIDVQAAALR